MIDTVVVGAGWSGLAAALELHDAGREVVVLDAAPQPGGRARALDITLGDRSYRLDNGQHLLIGAYRDTLALMKRLGVDTDAVFLRTPFALRYPDGFSMVARRLPAPLHLAAALLTARGLSWRDRVAMVMAVERWKAWRWTLTPDQPATALMHGLPPALIDRVWEPLCLAALNVRLEHASAQIFLTVLRDSLGAAAGDSDLLLARRDLSALLPDAAQAALGEGLRLRTKVTALAQVDGGWQIQTRAGTLSARQVVLAVPPERASDLLVTTGHSALQTSAATLSALDSAPIATVYLRYAPGTRLPFPVMALKEDERRAHLGQWVFDRGALDGHDGVLSVVISGAGTHQALAHEALGQAVARQLSDALALAAPRAFKVIEEKRATIVPAPGLRRPATRLPVPGLFIAADSAASPYPSTIEGSVRSGIAAAAAALSDLSSP